MNDTDFFRDVLGPSDPALDLPAFQPPQPPFTSPGPIHSRARRLAPLLIAAAVLLIVTATPFLRASLGSDGPARPAASGAGQELISVSVMTSTGRTTLEREVDAEGRSVVRDGTGQPTSGPGASGAKVDFVGEIPTQGLSRFLTGSDDPDQTLLAHRALTLRLTRHLDPAQQQALRETLAALAPTAEATAPDGQARGVRTVPASGALDGMDLLFDVAGHLVGQRYTSPDQGTVWEVVVDSKGSTS